MSAESIMLEKVKEYQGMTPRPEDFDFFWDEGISRVRQGCPEAELVRAELQVPGAECFDLYFKGIDGARIHAKYLRPARKKEKVPVVFLFHGYTGNAGDWFDKLSWVQLGFAVAAMDCRGQGGSSDDLGGVRGTTHHGHIVRGLLEEPDKLLFRQIFLDTAVLVKVVRGFAEVDDTKMATYGGSQGGALALVCAALVPEIKKTAVCYPFLCDYERSWRIEHIGSAYDELMAFFRVHDPLHVREEEFFRKTGYIDVQHFMPRVRADVLWAVALRDQSCPPPTQYAAYNRLETNKRMMFYPDYLHEALPGFQDECIGFMQF